MIDTVERALTAILRPPGGKKKKKPKGKTLALNDFLAEPGSGSPKPLSREPPRKSSSWADATDDIDPTGEEGGWVATYCNPYTNPKQYQPCRDEGMELQIMGCPYGLYSFSRHGCYV